MFKLQGGVKIKFVDGPFKEAVKYEKTLQMRRDDYKKIIGRHSRNANTDQILKGLGIFEQKEHQESVNRERMEKH